ncbi:hypothetical protein Syn7502_03564 [Synechococcus sp. PCC 7502]|uniref:hypothetical protein n=1 Tax=Synechococcus sp. PCC 7502 TaxID=1173263 RepID=UPI00029FA53D|nr:hypothetical protein [Synechococcus sp. PCC 7502]AFY75401.1 hypothetical protein Syn7502_03564 [Synechococcus sp. PCC 7502]
MPREPRKPDEYIVHLILEGNHVVDIRFNTIEEVKGYAAKLKAKSEEEELLSMPMKTDNELLLVRPKRISAIHAEPIFSSSVDMF